MRSVIKQRFQSAGGLSKEKIVYLGTVIFPLLVLYNAVFRPWLIHPERAFFLGAILVLAFLLAPLNSKGVVRGKIYLLIDLILIMMSIAAAMHMILDWEYNTIFMGDPRPIDIMYGIMAILVILEATRRTMLPLVPLCLLFLLYGLHGHYLTGTLAAPPATINSLVSHLYLTTQGILGIFLSVALKYIIPFLTMGCLLKAMGAMDVLSDFVNIAVGRTVGGPAKIAVVTSGMFGMMSGSSVANVAFTGTFTIPLMKRYGYKADFAAGVEATASTGGQLMPPIMGTSAFVMADYIGVPYVEIMVAAILPAILYYIAIFLRVHFKAKQVGLVRPSEDIIGRIKGIREIAPRLIPLVIIFIVLVTGLFMWTPTKAAVVTIAAIIPLSFLRRETWLTPRRILAGLREASYSFKPIGAAVLAIGILIGVATATGIGLKFSHLMLAASGHSLLLVLLLTAVTTIIFGMGIGGPAIYIFVALMLGPALVDLGLLILPAHLFIFYFSQMQTITPPVCLASYTAATIAGGNTAKTAFLAVSLGIVGFFIPFLFLFHTELLLIGSLVSSVMTFSLVAIGIAALTFALGGYLNRQLSLLERAVFLLLAVVVFIQWNYVISILGAAMIGVMIFISILIKRRSPILSKRN